MTKRTVLSKANQVYVFGFSAAFLIPAKILIQNFWNLKFSCDDLLPTDIVHDFRKWEKEHLQLTTIKIPRLMISCSKPVKFELVAFADASEKAYGCIVYLRVIDELGNIDVQYVIGKARVAPSKKKTLARLELVALLLSARISKYVMKSLPDLTFEQVSIFTDSNIALCWIQKCSTNWKPFVANRVQEIHDLFEPRIFHHVGGSENPADFLSRGLSLEKLKNSSLLWKGPSWLSLPTCEWPESAQNSAMPQECEAEAKKCKLLIAVPKEHSLVSRYEKYDRIVRVLAQILKWRKIIPRNQDGNLTCNDFETAEYHLIRNFQKRHFPDESEALEMGEPLSRKSRILCLDPTLDQETGLIVVGGRLNFSDLPEETKHQIIVPKDDLLTEKLILHCHTQNNHAPIETTLCILRQK